MASQQEDVVFVDAADSGLSHQSAAPQTTLSNSDQANTRATTTPAAPANGNRTDAERVGHPCPHCPKTFDRLEHLERHSRKHSGEKPFTCLYAGCGKGFSRYDNMIQHYHCHFDKGHRRKKRDLRETLKRSFMEQEGEARPLTPAENLTLRTLVQASFTPSYPCPAPLPRGRKPSRSKLAGNKGTGNPATMASGSPFTSASQSPMSFSRSTSPSEASSTPTSSSPASPAASVSTPATISANSSLSSLSSSTLPFSSPPSGILTPQCNEAPAPGSYLPFLFQPAQFVLPPSLGHTHSLNPRCQVDEAQLKLLKPKMF